MGPGRVEKADYIKETAKKYGRAYGVGAGGGALRAGPGVDRKRPGANAAREAASWIPN